jgi:3-methyladenine DNA glycosylase AlkD
MHPAIRRIADPRRADVLRRYFKTGPGEYGEGDVFAGVTVPQVRAIARACRAMPLADVRRLGTSKIHEDRLLSLLILVDRFKREPEPVYRTYQALVPHINNWDLVDLSAPAILGGWLDGRSLAPLRAWAASKNLWVRRMSILATQHFIRLGRFAPTLDVARRLLSDPHDLIHKATGWMLREVGKRDKAVLVDFLRRHLRRMPRTSLRYAIERFPARERRAWLSS